MKLMVLGPTGGTGLEIVRQAIEHGHRVTAFVRNPDRFAVSQGDLLNSAEVGKAIHGHDAVLSGFGPRYPMAKAERDLLRHFAVTLTRAMSEVAVRRVVVESVAFLFKDSIIPPAHLLGRLFFGDTVADASGMEDVFRKSGLDWIIVRPSELTNRPRTGKYRVREGHLPRFGFSISRADVADFMIGTGEKNTSVGKVVGVSN
jgi:putative NADH-flavin reductase